MASGSASKTFFFRSFLIFLPEKSEKGNLSYEQREKAARVIGDAEVILLEYVQQGNMSILQDNLAFFAVLCLSNMLQYITVQPSTMLLLVHRFNENSSETLTF